MKKNIKYFLMDIVDKFPFKDIAQITYSYDKELDIHFITVSPSNAMTDNNKIASWERKLWEKLYEDYPEIDVIITGGEDIDMFSVQEVCRSYSSQGYSFIKEETENIFCFENTETSIDLSRLEFLPFSIKEETENIFCFETIETNIDINIEDEYALAA